MPDRGIQLAPGCIVAFPGRLGSSQPFDHVVDGPGDLPYLVTTIDGGALWEIPFSDAGGYGCESPQISGDGPGERYRQHQGEGHTEPQRHQHQPQVVRVEEHRQRRSRHSHRRHSHGCDRHDCRGGIQRRRATGDPRYGPAGEDRHQADPDEQPPQHDTVVGCRAHRHLGHRQPDDHCHDRQENEPSHGSNRYPTPRTVIRWRGELGSSSILCRILRTWTVTVEGSCQ